MDRFGFVVGRCGSLCMVVGRFGSFWVVPRFSNYGIWPPFNGSYVNQDPRKLRPKTRLSFRDYEN